VKTFKEKYGSLENLHAKSISPSDLEDRLLEFKGVGPVGVNIFLRELRGVWGKVKPKPCSIAIKIAENIGLDPNDIEGCESQLVRIYLKYCKKHKSSICPLGNNCVHK
jgi:hypothetical protein